MISIKFLTSFPQYVFNLSLGRCLNYNFAICNFNILFRHCNNVDKPIEKESFFDVNLCLYEEKTERNNVE